MLSNAGAFADTVSTIQTDALEFSRREGIEYDLLFSCEAVHHFAQELQDVLTNIKDRQLKRGGRVIFEKPAEIDGGLPSIGVLDDKVGDGKFVSPNMRVNSLQLVSVWPMLLSINHDAAIRAIEDMRLW